MPGTPAEREFVKKTVDITTAWRNTPVQVSLVMLITLLENNIDLLRSTKYVNIISGIKMLVSRQRKWVNQAETPDIQRILSVFLTRTGLRCSTICGHGDRCARSVRINNENGISEYCSQHAKVQLKNIQKKGVARELMVARTKIPTELVDMVVDYVA